MARNLSKDELAKEGEHRRELIDMHFKMFERTAQGAGYKIESKKVFGGKATMIVLFYAEDGKPKLSVIEEPVPESDYKSEDKGRFTGPETIQDAEKRSVMTVHQDVSTYNPKLFRGAERDRNLKDEIQEMRGAIKRRDEHITALMEELAGYKGVTHKGVPPLPDLPGKPLAPAKNSVPETPQG